MDRENPYACLKKLAVIDILVLKKTFYWIHLHFEFGGYSQELKPGQWFIEGTLINNANEAVFNETISFEVL